MRIDWDKIVDQLYSIEDNVNYPALEEYDYLHEDSINTAIGNITQIIQTTWMSVEAYSDDLKDKVWDI